VTHGSTTGQKRQRQEQQRQEAARREKERLDRERRKKWRQRVVIGAAVVVIAVGAVVLTESLSSTDHHQVATSSDSTAVVTKAFAPLNHQALATTAPPWPAPVDSRPYILAAGLRVLSQEELAVHYHAHLDITVNDASVEVPAGIGFVMANGQDVGVAVLHTHNASGIIHIESPTNTPYTLGQFVTEWGVRFGPGQLGAMIDTNGNALRTYVDGKAFAGDPASIVLEAHQEIALWYGPTAATPHVPSSYQFPAGD
jgi:hypothetical protein